ncbi:MAG: DUF4065 domain-containing protein [Candidatus Ancillula sp.]|jgi:transcriptional regulator with XRE-family HTH domain|nr:DUF4065 domain-containing protein [Candidatus Ancillula sp.]
MFSKNLQDFRKISQLSQKEVAERIGVSRPTYSNYESGGTEPKACELSALADLFNITVDDLLSDEKAQEIVINFEESDFIQIKPNFNPDKFRAVLLYILNKVGAKPNIGETALYKLLYFIDMDFYEQHGRSITGLTYIKQKFGPTPKQGEFRPAVKSMQQHEDLEVIQTKYFNNEQKKYLPLTREKLSELRADELKHIDWELDRLSDKNASELSDFSHQDMPWMATKIKEQIEYKLVFYRTTVTRTSEFEDEL